MKALVTEAAGFIGSNLCRELAKRDFAVSALVLPGEDVNHLKNHVSRIYYGDLTKPSSIEGTRDDAA